MVELLKRLKASDVPKEAMFPIILDQVINGGLMLIAWRQRWPCDCPLCHGHHERIVVFASPVTNKPLEKLFCE